MKVRQINTCNYSEFTSIKFQVEITIESQIEIDEINRFLNCETQQVYGVSSLSYTRLYHNNIKQMLLDILSRFNP